MTYIRSDLAKKLADATRRLMKQPFVPIANGVRADIDFLTIKLAREALAEYDAAMPKGIGDGRKPNERLVDCMSCGRTHDVQKGEVTIHCPCGMTINLRAEA